MLVELSRRRDVGLEWARILIVHLDAKSAAVEGRQHPDHPLRVYQRVGRDLTHEQFDGVHKVGQLPSQAPLGRRMARVGDSADPRRQYEAFVVFRPVTLRRSRRCVAGRGLVGMTSLGPSRLQALALLAGRGRRVGVQRALANPHDTDGSRGYDFYVDANRSCGLLHYCCAKTPCRCPV